MIHDSFYYINTYISQRLLFILIYPKEKPKVKNQDLKRVMIVTKQRKQQPHPFQNYNNYDRHSQSYFLADKQNHPQRDNLTNLSIQKDKYTSYKPSRNSLQQYSYNKKNIYSNDLTATKKSQKKYDYSIDFKDLNKKQQLNKTHGKIVYQERQKIHKSPQINDQSIFIDQHERKRCSSVKNYVPKYKYTENNFTCDQKSQILKSSTKLTQQSKSNQFFRSDNTKYQHSLGKVSSKVQYTANKQNRPSSNVKSFFANDKFGTTEKFIEFKTQQKILNSQKDKDNNKFQPKYSYMRNNKRSEIINKSHQYLREQNSHSPQKQPQITKPEVNFQKLYQNSQAENKKISEKIHRITQLNTEINRRLEKMLLGKNLS